MNPIEKKTSKGWRVGDRVAWCPTFGAVILEIGEDDYCKVRFDDDSEGWHILDGSGCEWRRLRSKKITFKKEKSK